MTPFRLVLLLTLLASCTPEVPEGERWIFSSGAPIEDGCGLADAGVVVAQGKWLHELGVDDVTWTHEGDGQAHDPYECSLSGDDFACFGKPIEAATGLRGWFRGSYAPDHTSVTGLMTVANVCGAQLCGDGANGFYKACRSVVPVSASLLADTYPGPCPPAGTKSVPGAPAIVKLMKGSNADNLRLSQLDEEGRFPEGWPTLRTEPGEIAYGMQTNIGVWFIVHTKSGGQLTCVGAFQVTAPEMRVVIR